MANNSEKFIFSCMLGQERSVEMQSLAKINGYQTELLAGGLLVLTHLITKLHASATKESGESLYSFINNIQERIQENPEILSQIAINSSHSIYFRNLLTTQHETPIKFVITIDPEEVKSVKPGLALLSIFGEVYIVELPDLMIAIMTQTLLTFLEESNA